MFKTVYVTFCTLPSSVIYVMLYIPYFWLLNAWFLETRYSIFRFYVCFDLQNPCTLDLSFVFDTFFRLRLYCYYGTNLRSGNSLVEHFYAPCVCVVVRNIL